MNHFYIFFPFEAQVGLCHFPSLQSSVAPYCTQESQHPGASGSCLPPFSSQYFHTLQVPFAPAYLLAVSPETVHCVCRPLLILFG